MMSGYTMVVHISSLDYTSSQSQYLGQDENESSLSDYVYVHGYPLHSLHLSQQQQQSLSSILFANSSPHGVSLVASFYLPIHIYPSLYLGCILLHIILYSNIIMKVAQSHYSPFSSIAWSISHFRPNQQRLLVSSH